MNQITAVIEKIEGLKELRPKEKFQTITFIFADLLVLARTSTETEKTLIAEICGELSKLKKATFEQIQNNPSLNLSIVK